MSRGGIGVLEQPPGSLAWLEPENHSLFKTFQGHLAWADACKYGKNWAKAWCFASNSPRIGRLAALCNHNIQHESIAGVKNAKGEYLSTLTAEYPPLLAQQIIQSVSHRVSRISGECRPLPLQGTSSFRAPLGPRLKMCDGAGKPRTVESHNSIAKAWLRWAAKSGLDKRIFAHVAQAKNEPPLTSTEVREAIGLLFETIQQPLPSNLEPESQQPYRLHILRLVGAVTDDPDMALLHFMEHGVPTGATSPIPTSHQWPPATEQSEMEASTPLDLCDGNWKAATDHPTEVAALIQKEIDNGWVLEANMSVTEAQQHWPTGTAVGKLNIVFAEGKEPRLVLDSTICGVNPRCHLPERVALPMASDIRLATHASDHHGAFVGASIDFKAAHKQVKVREADHGLLLFQHNDKLYYYMCHFGGRFSAYWWQRVGAFLLRQVHHILSLMPHKAWLYVDDLLAALWRPSAIDGLALLIIFMQVINAPISWKKAQCQACITWCGWDVNFDYDTIQLTKGKISKLQEQIAELLSQPKACRKLLERTIGLLVWATSISLHLRPYLAPLYSDLNSPPGSQYAIPAPIWQIFRSSLTHMPGGPLHSNRIQDPRVSGPETPLQSRPPGSPSLGQDSIHQSLKP